MFSVIYILIIRQIKRYSRMKPRIIGSLGQPILFLLALGYGLGPVFKKAGSGDYIQFLAPGVIAQAILFMAVFSGIELIWDRQFGFLKETLVAPVPRLHIMLGKTLGGAIIATFQGVIVLILTFFIGFRPISWMGFIPAFLVMFLIALFYTGLGTAIASLMEDFHGFQLIMNFLVMPTFFLSGAIFPLKGVPPVFSLISRLNPLTYGVDGLRFALTGVNLFPLYFNIFLLLLLSGIILVIGGYLFSKIEI